MTLAPRILNFLFLFLIARLFTDHLAFRFQIFSGNFFDFWHSLFQLATVFLSRHLPFSKLPVKFLSDALRHAARRGATEYPRRALEGRSGTKLGPLFGGHRGAVPQVYNIITLFRRVRAQLHACHSDTATRVYESG